MKANRKSATGIEDTPRRKSDQITVELEAQREIAARLPGLIEEAARDHTEALQEFDAERGRPALARKRKAEEDLAEAKAAISRLETELREAEAEEAEAARRERYEKARLRANAARDAFVREYPDLAEQIVVLVREVALADQAIEAANADRPVGEPHLLPISQEIWSRTEARVELGEELVSRWIRRADAHLGARAAEIPTELKDTIEERNGKMTARTGMGYEIEVLRQDLVKCRFLPAMSHSGPTFPQLLSLPALPHGRSYFEPSSSSAPGAVLAALDGIEAKLALRAPGRREQVEWLLPEEAARQALPQSE